MREISEDDLRRLRRGEIEGLEAAYRCYSDRVYRVCQRMLGGDADAEDALQEVFLRLFDQAVKFDGRSRFSTWLYRLAVNRCLNLLKQRGRQSLPSLSAIPESSLPPDPAPSPLEVAAREEERQIADRLLDELGPEHKAIVVLREIEGLSYGEIGEALEIPIGTVMSRLARAREKLARVIADYRQEGGSRGTEYRRGGELSNG